MRSAKYSLRLSLLTLTLLLTNIPIANSAENAPIAPLVEGLGNYSYPVSNCSGHAQAFFDQGLRLFYGFRYPESLASFQEASRLDPDCPMTYWGEALAAGPTPNSRYLEFPDDPKGAGAAAITRAMALRAAAPQKEKALIEALAKLYDNEANPNRTTRDELYLDAMGKLAAATPADPEISTLYAEAFMTRFAWDYWTPDGAPRAGTLNTKGILEKVLANTINHPGANHLFIHLLEDSQAPEHALPHAERLAETMPGVGHMVHMPSHIYIRTGRYEKSIDSNKRSIEAADSFIRGWGNYAVPMGVTSLSSSDRTHAGHAIDFIHLAAVLQGNYNTATTTAARIAADAKPHLSRFGGFQRRYVKPLLTRRRFADWRRILELPAPAADYPFINGIWHFVRASAFVNTGNQAAAHDERAKLLTLIGDEKIRSLRVWVNDAQTLLSIALHVIDAELAADSKDFDTAIAEYAFAIRLEDGLNYMEPPDWGHPVRLELGALLLRLGRHDEAATVFWEDLRRNPENGWALHGVWQSLLAGSNGADDVTKQVAQARQRFDKAWANADTQLRGGRALAR